MIRWSLASSPKGHQWPGLQPRSHLNMNGYLACSLSRNNSFIGAALRVMMKALPLEHTWCWPVYSILIRVMFLSG